jgi:hypothetical protein
MAKRFQFTQILGYKNRTAVYEDPFGGNVKFTVKPYNDPDFVDWLRENRNDAEVRMQRAMFDLTMDRQANQVPAEAEGLSDMELLFFYIKRGANDGFAKAFTVQQRAEEAAQLVTHAEGLLSYDDTEEEPELKPEPYSYEAVLDVLRSSHGEKIDEGEHKGKYVNDVLIEGVISTAKTLADVDEAAQEEAAKN